MSASFSSTLSSAPRQRPLLLWGFDFGTQKQQDFSAHPWSIAFLRRSFTNENYRGFSKFSDDKKRQIRHGNNICVLFQAMVHCSYWYDDPHFWPAISKGFSCNVQLIRETVDILVRARLVGRTIPGRHRSATIDAADVWLDFLDRRMRPRRPSAEDVMRAASDFYISKQGSMENAAKVPTTGRFASYSSPDESAGVFDFHEDPSEEYSLDYPDLEKKAFPSLGRYTVVPPDSPTIGSKRGTELLSYAKDTQPEAKRRQVREGGSVPAQDDTAMDYGEAAAGPAVLAKKASAAPIVKSDEHGAPAHEATADIPVASSASARRTSLSTVIAATETQQAAHSSAKTPPTAASDGRPSPAAASDGVPTEARSVSARVLIHTLSEVQKAVQSLTVKVDALQASSNASQEILAFLSSRIDHPTASAPQGTMEDAIYQSAESSSGSGAGGGAALDCNTLFECIQVINNKIEALEAANGPMQAGVACVTEHMLTVIESTGHVIDSMGGLKESIDELKRTPPVSAPTGVLPPFAVPEAILKQHTRRLDSIAQNMERVRRQMESLRPAGYVSQARPEPQTLLQAAAAASNDLDKHSSVLQAMCKNSTAREAVKGLDIVAALTEAKTKCYMLQREYK